MLQLPDETKPCCKCQFVKPKSNFYKDASRVDGKTPACIACHKAYTAATKAQRAAAKAESYRADPTQTKARANNYRAANPELVAARKAAAFAKLSDAEKAAHYIRLQAWKRNNPGKVAANTRARQSRKLQATPAWASLDKISEFFVLANLCTRVTGIEYHVDHIVPLRSPLVCGLHNEFNLQILTATENIKKSSTTWPDQP